MKKIKSFWHDTRGDSIVVEATFLFPIMIGIFVGLILLSAFLPARASLQRATQYAATVLAIEQSDTWIFYDEGVQSLLWSSGTPLPQVGLIDWLRGLFGANDNLERARDIVIYVDESGPGFNFGTLERGNIEFAIEPVGAHREVVVSAVRVINVPFELPFGLPFPTEIRITAASTAIVMDGDGFVRDMKLAVDYINLARTGVLERVFGSLIELLGFDFIN